MSADRPRRPRPAGGRPSGGRPSGGRPSGGRPSGSRPSDGSGGSGRPGARRTGDGASGSSTDGRSGRPSGPGRSGPPRGGKPGGGKPGGGKPATGRPGGRSGAGRPPRRDGDAGDDRRGGRPVRGRSGAAVPRRAGDERPTRPEPRNEAERRAAEVRSRRGPRTPQDPSVERERIEARETEQWIDEGSVRSEAEAATARAKGAGGAQSRRPAEVDPEVVAEIHATSPDPRRATRLTERLAAASAALDRDRYDDARRMVSSVVRELPMLASGHEVHGLANYRLGNWKQAAQALEAARAIRVDPAVLPVLADCYRAMKRWSDVDRVWREIRGMSPPHEVMAEGRIVAAGALADQGDLKSAIALMQQAQKPPKKLREHHLRQWYVLADLLDRAGDTVGAARLFRDVAAGEPDFADVRERLRGLGR